MCSGIMKVMWRSMSFPPMRSTDVIMEILPAALQEEIHEGKYLKNEEELYNFLENYTS